MISILMPIYNGIEYIGESVSSIIVTQCSREYTVHQPKQNPFSGLHVCVPPQIEFITGFHTVEQTAKSKADP